MVFDLFNLLLHGDLVEWSLGLLEFRSTKTRMILHKVLAFILSWSRRVKQSFRVLLCLNMRVPYPFQLKLQAQDTIFMELSCKCLIISLLISCPESVILDFFVLLEAHLFQLFHAFTDRGLLEFSLMRVIRQNSSQLLIQQNRVLLFTWLLLRHTKDCKLIVFLLTVRRPNSSCSLDCVFSQGLISLIKRMFLV